MRSLIPISAKIYTKHKQTSKRSIMSIVYNYSDCVRHTSIDGGSNSDWSISDLDRGWRPSTQDMVAISTAFTAGRIDPSGSITLLDFSGTGASSKFSWCWPNALAIQPYQPQPVFTSAATTVGRRAIKATQVDKMGRTTFPTVASMARSLWNRVALIYAAVMMIMKPSCNTFNDALR